MINIVFGPPGVGKTSYLVYKTWQAAFDLERNRQQKNAIYNLQAKGFAVVPPEHCACCSFSATYKKFGFKPRASIYVNPYRMGFANEWVETQFIAPYSVIGICEGQQYYDSRMSRFFPAWVSRYFEAHRHFDLDIYIDVQRADLIDLNIRSLAKLIEIVAMKVFYDKFFGRPVRVVWQIREFASLSEYELYMNSGKTKECYREYEDVAECNIFDMYDSKSCKPKFFEGHFSESFSSTHIEQPDENIEKYIKYLELVNDQLPKNFYRKVA